MTIDEKYMRRCLHLAAKGIGFTKPNPMVGAVIVHSDRIIGEGYHRKYGEPHAEVNAIMSVKDSYLLSESTLYVSLEPCSHYGKTPPCAALIVSKKIPRVVVACSDPNPMVSGNGIQMMKDAGIDVSLGLLQKEAEALNRSFFVNQLYNRPYITLKWAQSRDGFIDHHRTSLSENPPVQLSNNITMSLVHKLRTEVQGIMVGTNTVMLDNPRLTARKWYGENPVRIAIDRAGLIPADSAIFNDEADTILFTQRLDYPTKKNNLKTIAIDFADNVNRQILEHLYREGIYSVMVEGGSHLLQSFIDAGMWDEAFVEIAPKNLVSGVKSPGIWFANSISRDFSGSVQIHLKNEISRKFL
ncbi:MAG: bifunctional diaminohydroxyphosphoribosylaminopyrimidine deaminase/5-amino-6-(5-phosphoribosylamino)uracil reductase RibD [Dysgonamonadaceae bacterium]|jgi:diaminohydroxyphosphoribosylaminopyrimidine deaminase/5-amino-6-(5-phosphoribosylamino)uracil reductase|nr:bifunctional diaminohydroxyphosphoribosylaminopyrimidine deaminase/5-amino-6-(5-phosphoribosylamino)uracil reductase RibD [Dysgonamonadaceae bacterium]